MARRRELRALEGKEGTCNCMKAEGVAFLQDEPGGLTPDFDEDGLRHNSTPVGFSSRPMMPGNGGRGTMAKFQFMRPCDTGSECRIDGGSGEEEKGSGSSRSRSIVCGAHETLVTL